MGSDPAPGTGSGSARGGTAWSSRGAHRSQPWDPWEAVGKVADVGESGEAGELRGGLERRAARLARELPLLLGLVLALGLASPAPAVLLAGGDGERNTAPPADDFGLDHLGRVGSLGGLYVGRGWVLTAAHVGVNDLDLDGVLYVHDPDSVVLFENPDPSDPRPDLRAFRLAGDPAEWPSLPPLPLATETPAEGDEVVLAGWGRDRGEATTWSPSVFTQLDGWTWAGTRSRRWGTNRVDATGVEVPIGSRLTWALSTTFTDPGDPSPPGATDDEAQVTVGDSGGALFAVEDGEWVLAGILFAETTYADQPAQTSLFGNQTLAVDLAVYRDQVQAVVAAPCSNGVDDDGDGLVDFPEDPACFDASWESESSACDDGLDNDGDGFADWDGAGLGDPDPQCQDTPWRDKETPSSCGLGAELAFGVLGWAWRRSRRRRHRGQEGER